MKLKDCLKQKTSLNEKFRVLDNNQLEKEFAIQQLEKSKPHQPPRSASTTSSSRTGRARPRSTL